MEQQLSHTELLEEVVRSNKRLLKQNKRLSKQMKDLESKICAIQKASENHENQSQGQGAIRRKKRKLQVPTECRVSRIE